MKYISFSIQSFIRYDFIQTLVKRYYNIVRSFRKNILLRIKQYDIHQNHVRYSPNSQSL
jgi:hypothetical protein